MPSLEHPYAYAYLRDLGAVPHLIQMHEPVFKKLQRRGSDEWAINWSKSSGGMALAFCVGRRRVGRERWQSSRSRGGSRSKPDAPAAYGTCRATGCVRVHGSAPS